MRRIRLVLGASWLALTIGSCGPYGGASGQPTSAMAIPPTLAPLILSPAWTPTLSPAPVASPTATVSASTRGETETPLPLSTLPPGSARVSFPGGGTEASESGELAAGSTQSYVVGAAQGQIMMVSVDSPNHDLVIGIYGSTDGTWLLTPTQRQASFQGALPRSQDYVIEVVARQAGDSFTLSMTIAQTIILQAGGNPYVVTGSAQQVPWVTYLLPVKAGQTLTLDLQSKSSSALLTVRGLQDGRTILALSNHATHFSGALPASEDYLVQVVQGASPSNFTIKMKLG